MDMQLNQESYSYVQLKYRLLAQIALLISYPLTKSSPKRIESLINKLSESKLSATENEAVLARDAICTVSRKCRNQDGCVKRSLGVIMFLLLLNKRASWCTGFAMDPFRSHAWVEVNGNPIKELEEVSSYERVVKTLDDKNEERKHMISEDIEKVDDTITSVKFRDLLALIENKRKYFLIVLCLGILTSILTLLQPELLSKVISQKGVNLLNNPTIYTLIAITVGSTIISSLQYYFLQLMGESAVFQSRKNLIIQFLKLPIYKYNDLSAGDLISRFSSDTSKLRAGIVQSTVALTSGLFLSLGAIFTLFLKDTYLAIITIISIALSFLFILFMSSLIQTASYKAHQGLGKMTAYLNRLIVGIRTIRSTNETNSELSKMLSEAQEVKNLGIGVARVQSIMTPISNFSLQLCGIIILGVGGYRVSTGQMSVANLTSFMLLMYIAISPVGQIFSSVTTISEALGALGRITEIIDLPKEEDNDIILNLESTSDRSKAIEFANVTFSYDSYQFQDIQSDDNYILKDITFEINSGDYVSIVGPSGAGKSTLLYLIERFYDITSGSIKIFGQDFRTMNRETLRSNIAYVEQNSPLVAGTILENLKMGNSTVTYDECCDALEKVGLEHLIQRGASGIESPIGEGSFNLSGGERQRLAMARAILSDAKILLLDELTSNLDSLSEKKMKEAIKGMRGERTIIMVAHRLSTILDSDEIFVLEHGRLVGSGTHVELLESVPLYKELAKEQFLV